MKVEIIVFKRRSIGIGLVPIFFLTYLFMELGLWCIGRQELVFAER